MPAQPLDDWFSLAVRLARAARPIALEGLADLQTAVKPDTSVVTRTDHAIQAMILDELARLCPTHAVIAEEHDPAPDRHAPRATARYCWAIDPLDGTRNYVAGIPCFSTSIALLDAGRPILGVVYDHNLDWTYAATEGRGASLNDRPIHVRNTRTGPDRLVGISSSKSHFTIAVIRDWSARPGLVLRNLGSTALHLALVASGGLDATLCTKCKIWDIAAGGLLVTEAGGRLTTPGQADPFPFLPADDPATDRPVLAAGLSLHQELARSLPPEA